MPFVDDRELLCDPAPVRPEVLIEQARWRQRHRRLLASWLIALLAIGATIFGISSGGRPPGNTPPVLRAATPAGVSVLSWHEVAVSDGYITPEAQITTVINWHGELIAAGEGGASARRCHALACNPVVWIAHDGHWHAVFAAPAEGSLANADLVATRHGLLLFCSQEGTRLWRSTNGRVWRSVRPPDAMAANSLVQAVSNSHTIVALIGNRFAGGPDTAYGESDFIWTSTGGLDWTQRSVPDRPQFASLTVTPAGFLAAGISRATGRQLIWRSTNGRTWSSTPAPAGSDGRDYIAANAHRAVLEWIPDTGHGTPRFWSSSNQHAWLPATASSNTPANLVLFPNQRPLLALPDGFLAFGHSNHQIFWSATGHAWRTLPMTNTPSTAFQPVGATVNGTSLLVIETASRKLSAIPSGASAIWQLAPR
ncbi:MAG: hypothetical protein ACP5H2_10945 [Solirubrobacteraceae bacterium]